MAKKRVRGRRSKAAEPQTKLPENSNMAMKRKERSHPEQRLIHLPEFMMFDLEGFMEGKDVRLIGANKATEANTTRFTLHIQEDNTDYGVRRYDGVNADHIFFVEVPNVEANNLPIELFVGGQRLTYDNFGRVETAWHGQSLVIKVAGLLVDMDGDSVVIGEYEQTSEETIDEVE